MKQRRGREILWLGLAVVCAAWLAGPVWAEEAAKPAEPPAATPESKESEQPSLTGADAIDAWMEKAKNPVPWLTWGTDLRLREVYQANNVVTSKYLPNHERHWERYRWRFWSTVTPPFFKDLDFNWRVVYEPRYYHKPAETHVPHEWESDDILLDRLNFTLRNVGGLPLTVTAGRQDIILGNGWLVLDGTPLDGSRTIYFDAFRFTYDAKPIDTTFDVIYLDMDGSGDHWFHPFRDRGTAIAEQDERGLVFYATNKSFQKTQIDGYYIYKRDMQEARNIPAHIHTFGARTVHDLTDHWQFREEFALQYGQRRDADIRAGAFNSRLTYFWKDKMDNQFRVGYEFLSGDDPTTDEYERFDPLWGRWPQWSELYIYTVAPESGRPADMSNLHRIGFGHSFKPTKELEVCTDYHLLFCDENADGTNPVFYSHNGYFRGQLLTALMRYKFTKHISGHLLGEFFFPGNFYENFDNDPAAFLRYELTFTW